MSLSLDPGWLGTKLQLATHYQFNNNSNSHETDYLSIWTYYDVIRLHLPQLDFDQLPY